MIDMSGLYSHKDYEEVLERFKVSSCRWSEFLDVHLEVAKYRCPICEVSLREGELKSRVSRRGTTTIEPTIDHYRPQKYYRFLKCNPKNYILMCSECNNIYKKSEFPLYKNQNRAISEDGLKDEKPLIVNPISDNIYELFTLVFRPMPNSNKMILELKVNIEDKYLMEKAKETIKLFGLGDCEVNRHSNSNVYRCRIEILESHFNIFYGFAKALKDKDKRKASLELRDKKEIFESYGFFEFLRRKQFEILI